MERGVNAPHRRSDAQHDLEEVPHVSMDYGFLGERESEGQVSPVLVIRERRHKMTRKGTEFTWIGKRAARFIDQLGHNRVTLRCDNEPAIEALAREIGQARQEGSQTVPERPPVGESQSNGIIERTVGVAGQAKTLKAALEHRMENGVPPDARILCWLVEFAAYLMNRCDVGSDGKTPLHKTAWTKGQHTHPGIRREDSVRMPAKPARGGKWEPRFHLGVFVEMLNSSSEAVVVTEQGTAIKTRSAT